MRVLHALREPREERRRRGIGELVSKPFEKIRPSTPARPRRRLRAAGSGPA